MSWSLRGRARCPLPMRVSITQSEFIHGADLGIPPVAASSGRHSFQAPAAAQWPAPAHLAAQQESSVPRVAGEAWSNSARPAGAGQPWQPVCSVRQTCFAEGQARGGAQESSPRQARISLADPPHVSVCTLSITCGAALLLNLPGLQAVQEGRSRSHSPSLALQAALLAGLPQPSPQQGPHMQLPLVAPGSSLLLPQLMSSVSRLPAPARPGTPRAWRCPSPALSLLTYPMAPGQEMPLLGTTAALPSLVGQHQLCT